MWMQYFEAINFFRIHKIRNSFERKLQKQDTYLQIKGTWLGQDVKYPFLAAVKQLLSKKYFVLICCFFVHIKFYQK